MKRYRGTDLMNFFTKKQDNNECDGGKGTEEVSIEDNSISKVVNDNELIAVKLNIVSVAQSEDLGETDVCHRSLECFWTIAVSAKLTDADRFRFLTEFYSLQPIECSQKSKFA